MTPTKPTTTKRATPARPRSSVVKRKPAAAAQSGSGAAAPSQQVLRAVNRYRDTQGKADLAWDARLAKFAQARAQDMLARDYFSHRDPETGKSYLEQLGSAHANGETLYQLSGNVAAKLPQLGDLALAEWQDSPPHAAIIADARMTRGGVGVGLADRQVIVVLVVEQ